MRKVLTLGLALALGACSTAQLQNEAVRLQAINAIVCESTATLQPIVVPLAATVTVIVDPALAAPVAGAVALDNKLHPELQALCPINDKLLGAMAAPVPAGPIATDAAASVATVPAK